MGQPFALSKHSCNLLFVLFIQAKTPNRAVENGVLHYPVGPFVFRQPLGKEPFRRWEPFGIHNSSGFPNRIPAISLKNVQVGAVPSSTVYLQPL